MASFQLLHVVILICKRKLAKLRSQRENSERILSSTLDKATIKQIHIDLNIFGCNLRNKMEKTKLNKFQTLQKRNTNHSIITKTLQMKKDGNCFFRCLAEQLLGDAELHAATRDKVVSFMTLHRNEYVHLVDGDFEEHMKFMQLTDGRTSSWATEAEISAAARCFDINIFVNRRDGLSTEWLKLPLSEDCNHNKQFICISLNHEHFDLLHVSNRPCTCDMKNTNKTNLKRLDIPTFSNATRKLSRKENKLQINKHLTRNTICRCTATLAMLSMM